MNAKQIIRVVISVALLWAIIYWIELDRIWEYMASANLFYLGLGILVASMNRILMPFKWNLLLRVKNIYVSWYDVIVVYYNSSFLGLFLPPTVGADVVRAYMVGRKKYPFTDIIPSILVERLLGMVALLLFGIMGCLIYLSRFSTIGFNMQKLMWIIIVFVVLVISGFVVSLSDTFKSIAFKFIGHFTLIKYLDKFIHPFQKLYLSYQSYRNSKGTLAVFFILTCLENILYILRSYIIALALNVHLPLSYFFVIIPLVLVLVRLPISVDGFGIQEGAMVYFLSVLGVTEALAFSVGITNHFISLITLLPGAVIHIFNRGIKAPDLSIKKNTSKFVQIR
jgi:glycosyltransferase 2 family protein